MATIQDYLNQIKNAIYGKDVRQAIHDGIQQCYYDGKVGSIDLEARQRLDSAEGDIDTLDARVDQIVAPSGEAPSAAEVADGRIVDGVTYDLIGDAIRAVNTNLKNTLKAGRSGTVIINPMGQYKYSSDGLSVVDFASMPLNTYIYAQYSVVKTALNGAGFPLSWGDSDYVSMFRLAVGNQSLAVSIIKLYNFNKSETATMLYYATTGGNKYRWIVPTTDLSKQYFPADAKKVGDTIYIGRNSATFTPMPYGWQTSSGGSLDFRDLPLNSYSYVTYDLIKGGLSDTNMPESDWADTDIVYIRRDAVRTEQNNSIITIFNFTKTRKLEMLYYANSSGNKYRWLLHGTINYNTFENTINQYSNTYSVTATPSITTDTNNYLQPTGDQTDMASAIVTMLTQTGVCNLASGDFYVSGIEMPEDSMIRGCGTSTNIILLPSVTSGFAIKMNTRCIVTDVMISGDTSTPTITSEIGTRDGILWQGTAIPDQSTTSSTPLRGTISNCYIRNFTGSGIRCYGTGTGISNCLNAVNTYVYNSTVGVYIEWLSEFHRFTNVDCRGCYYGMINNGGNNTITSCGFSKNMVGLLMDNTYGQSNNNSHGSFSNCVFNHSGSNNDGIAIHIIGCVNGEVFSGCQLFYGETVIEESEGIVFANCNFGGSSGTQITITNGGLIMYNGCVFKTAPTVTKTGNTATKFINCYLRDGTAVALN